MSRDMAWIIVSYLAGAAILGVMIGLGLVAVAWLVGWL
jgi:hypothetical protein